LCQGKSKADHLVMWAGMFPPDLQFEIDKKVFQQMQVQLVIGDQDEFLQPELLNQQIEMLQSNAIPFELVRFSGTHTIDVDVLKSLV